MPIPKASIIIPLLNQEDAWLRQAVLSALHQTVPCEVLVITSPHTPESNLLILDEILHEHQNLKVIIRDPGTRFAAALNLGIRRSNSDRVGFLMSDDWLDARTVEQCLARSEDIVSTGRTFYAADGCTVLEVLAQQHTDKAYRALRRPADRANFLGLFMLFRRKALESVGGVDETLGDSPGVDDFDLPWCLLERGASVAIVPERLYNCRDHEGQRLTRLGRDAMIATFNRILDKHSVSAKERRRLMDEHSPWFGTSMYARYRELTFETDLGPLFRQLQKLYRRSLPMTTRLWIHSRIANRFGSNR